MWFGGEYQSGVDVLMDEVCYDVNVGSNTICNDFAPFNNIFTGVVKDTDHEFRVFDLEPCKKKFAVKVVEYLGTV